MTAIKITPAEHARLSPSGSKKWLACPGSLTLEAPYPNRGNQYSDEGTACHEVAARCLTQHYRARKWVTEFIPVHKADEEPRFVQFTDAMADMVQPEVDVVRKLTIGARAVLIEHRVNFSDVIGVPDQFGTLDVGIVTDDLELVIIDFKFGHTPVEAEHNTQLMIYALGLYDELCLSHDIRSVRLMIRQPKYHDSEWQVGLDYLMGDFTARLRSGAISTINAERDFGHVPQVQWELTYLNQKPNDQECAFCRAMSTCPSYNRAVQEAIGADFEAIASTDLMHLVERPVPSLTAKMKAVSMVEDWCKAVRAEMERHLLAGNTDPAFGLELGRKGPRKWSDPEQVQHMLRKVYRIRLEDAYELSLKSPTQIEKLIKPTVIVDNETGAETEQPAILGPRRWLAVAKFITQSDPKPSVKALATIKKPYTPPQPDAADFEAVSDDEQLW